MTAISFPQRLTSVESDIARIAPDRTIPMIRIIAPIESDERSCIESPICIIEEKHHTPQATKNAIDFFRETLHRMSSCMKFFRSFISFTRTCPERSCPRSIAETGRQSSRRANKTASTQIAAGNATTNNSSGST